MVNSLLKKAQCVLFILLNILSFAQSVPPPPENPESGGIGGYPASPIDAYTLLLFFVGVFVIVMVTLRSRLKSVQ